MKENIQFNVYYIIKLVMADIINCDKKTDEQLVKLTLGNQDYFLCLMKRYEGKLLNYILRISNVSYQEGEDILQEIFIKIYRNLNDFNDKYKFSTWVYRIARNETISHYRKNNAKDKDLAIDVEDDVFERIAADLDIEKDIRNKEMRIVINKALGRINKKYREVITLRFLEDKDYKEISYILKKPTGTIATWLNRAKEELRKELNRENINL